jgi:hypothetical protein
LPIVLAAFYRNSGKRLLGLALGELRARKDLHDSLGMKPKVPGRAAFTGRGGEGVWDFLSLWPDADKHTDFPHLTLGMNAQAVSALVIVPNRVRIRRNVIEVKKEGFEELAGKIVKKMTPLLRKYPAVTRGLKACSGDGLH